MHAKVRVGEFAWCQNCGVRQVSQLEEFTQLYDKDGDSYGDTGEYGDIDEATSTIEDDDDDDTYLPLTDRLEYECNSCSNTTVQNSLNGPPSEELKLIDEVWSCGKCGTTYINDEQAGDCCNES